jgi:hypothetical protein
MIPRYYVNNSKRLCDVSSSFLPQWMMMIQQKQPQQQQENQKKQQQQQYASFHQHPMTTNAIHHGQGNISSVRNRFLLFDLPQQKQRGVFVSFSYSSPQIQRIGIESHVSFRRRYMSSSSHDPNNTSNNTNHVVTKNHDTNHLKDNDEIVLFHRGTLIDTLEQSRLILVIQCGQVLSCFHTCSWIWFKIVVVPIANASPSEYLHISESFGLGGIFFASIILSIFVLYPKWMVSKVAYRPSDAMIDIYTYHIPWMIPATKPTVSFPTTTTRTTTTKMRTTEQLQSRRTSLLDPTSDQAKYIYQLDINGRIIY